jgi:biopolymer transport protein ExbB
MDTLVYVLLGLTSVVGLAFVVERAWTLRWQKVVPPAITASLAACKSRDDVKTLCRVCEQKPSPLGRLLLLAADHLNWPKDENVDALQTAARHEIVRLERGLVVLEVIVGIAPLLGLVGTIAGMMMLFGKLGQTCLNNAQLLAEGIALILNATLMRAKLLTHTSLRNLTLTSKSKSPTESYRVAVSAIVNVAPTVSRQV